MNFSELFKHTGQLCQFSPDGMYMANVVQYRLIIREVKSLQILNLFTCLDAIQYIEWSADSQFVLCGMYKRSLVQVWSLEQPEWTCKIDEGSAGLVAVRWSPDGRHVLTTAEFHLRVTVWSLLNKSVSYIKHPKACHNGLDFSAGGKYLAMAERRDCKDHISVFDTSNWTLVKHFEPQTDDMAGIGWSPDGRVLAVWESCLKYSVQLYTLDGRLLSTFSAYNEALGIKCVTWSPTSQFLAVGSYDQKVRILNHVTWKKIVEFDHPGVVDDSNVTVYRESVKKTVLKSVVFPPPLGDVSYSAHSKYDVVCEAVTLPSTKPEADKANPKMGVGAAAFSPDTRYMYTRNDNQPRCLWIWDVVKLRLAALLVQEETIKAVSWDPCSSRLALCCGNNRIYMWSPAGALSVQVPAESTFTVHHLTWHPAGNILVLLGKVEMCVCFLVADSNSNDTGANAMEESTACDR